MSERPKLAIQDGTYTNVYDGRYLNPRVGSRFLFPAVRSLIIFSPFSFPRALLPLSDPSSYLARTRPHRLHRHTTERAAGRKRSVRAPFEFDISDEGAGHRAHADGCPGSQGACGLLCGASRVQRPRAAN